MLLMKSAIAKIKAGNLTHLILKLEKCTQLSAVPWFFMDFENSEIPESEVASVLQSGCYFCWNLSLSWSSWTFFWHLPDFSKVISLFYNSVALFHWQKRIHYIISVEHVDCGRKYFSLFDESGGMLCIKWGTGL